MLGKSHIIAFVFIFLLASSVLIYSAYAKPIIQQPTDVWWDGTPDFVINETTDFWNGTSDDTYPSEDALRMGYPNERFGVNTTYPSSTLVNANWTWGGTNMDDVYWVANGGGRIYGAYTRVTNDRDYYLYNLSQIYSETDDFAWSFEINCTSQPALVQGRHGLFNSSCNYPTTNTHISLMQYHGSTGCYINHMQVIDNNGNVDNHINAFAMTQYKVYQARCYWDADGGAGGNPRTGCNLYDTTDWSLDHQWQIDTGAVDIDIDQLGVATSGASTKGGTIYTYTDNYVFNNESATNEEYYPTTSIWTSDTITMTSDNLLNMTINLTASATEYIDKVEWIADDDNEVLASNLTDIASSGLVTYSTANGLSTGSFADVDEDFKIVITLAGDGTDTPIIYDIIGFFAAADSTPPQITIDHPANTTYCTNSLWFNVTGNIGFDSCEYSLDNGTNVSMTNTTGNWNDYYTLTSCLNCSHNVTAQCERSCVEWNSVDDTWNSDTTYFWACCSTADYQSAIPLSLIILAGILIYIFIGFHNSYKQDTLTVGTKLLFLGVGLMLIICTIFAMGEMADMGGLTDVGDMMEDWWVFMLFINTFFIFIFVLYTFRFIITKVFGVKI